MPCSMPAVSTSMSGRAVVVAGDAEVQAAVVGEDRHHDADRADDRDVRVGLEQPPAERLHRPLRAGHVGRRGVHVQARRAASRAGCRAPAASAARTRTARRARRRRPPAWTALIAVHLVADQRAGARPGRRSPPAAARTPPRRGCCRRRARPGGGPTPAPSCARRGRRDLLAARSAAARGSRW